MWKGKIIPSSELISPHTDPSLPKILLSLLVDPCAKQRNWHLRQDVLKYLLKHSLASLVQHPSKAQLPFPSKATELRPQVPPGAGSWLWKKLEEGHEADVPQDEIEKRRRKFHGLWSV